MVQWWDTLTFVHWRFAASDVQRLLPDGLAVETFDGTAWVGLVPFFLRVGLPRMPSLPWMSRFPETNVRTYVVGPDGRPGIYFFSLDAASAPTVMGAGPWYGLSYVYADASLERHGSRVRFTSERRHPRAPAAAFAAEYRPVGPVARAGDGLDAWLTERYCAYTAAGPSLRRAEIHHPPWPLQAAELQLDLTTMTPDGIDLPADAPLVHFSARQDVVIWPLERVAA